MGLNWVQLRIFAFLAAILFYFTNSSMAAEVSGFRISQVNAKLPAVKVYLDISDESGTLVPDITPDLLKVTLGAEQADVKSIKPFASAEEGIAYILLVDISKSLKEAQFIEIRKALTAWIDDISPKDRMLVMTFGTQVTLLQDFTQDKAALKAKVNQIKPSDNDTQLHSGLVKAMEAARRTDADLPSRRVIVTMSDGKNDFAGGMTKEEVLNRIKEEQVPIYAIGYYKPPSTPAKENFLKVLGEFSRTSGGEYHKAGNHSFSDMYTAIRKRIQNVYVASLECGTCTGDGRIYRLQMTISAGHKSLTDGKDIRLLPNQEVPPGTPEEANSPVSKKWIYTGAGSAGLLLLIILPVLKKSKNKPNKIIQFSPEVGLGGISGNPVFETKIPDNTAPPKKHFRSA